MSGTGGAIDIGQLPLRTARELERYVRSKISFKSKSILSKKPPIKKPSNIAMKNDLAPASLAPPKPTLTHHSSAVHSRPSQSHLPVFSEPPAATVEFHHGIEHLAHSEERSKSSSFYSGTCELTQIPTRNNIIQLLHSRERVASGQAGRILLNNFLLTVRNTSLHCRFSL
jgi:hypothetical protein